MNYKFTPPNFNINDNNESYVEEEETNSKNCEITNQPISDEEEPTTIAKKIVTKSALFQQNTNNSRFTSATTRADEGEEYVRFKNKELEELDVRRAILQSNIEPLAWKKEFDKFGDQLEEFDKDLQKNPDNVIKGYEKDDFQHYLKELNSSSKVQNYFYIL